MNTGMQLTKPLRADRQIGDDHVGPGLLEDLDDVDRRARGLGDLLRQVLAQAVVGHAALDLDAEIGHLGVELQRVVLAGEDRLVQRFADLVSVDVKRGRELDVSDVVAAQVDMHQAGHRLGWIGVPVVVDALDKRARAVADADDRDADLLVLAASRSVRGDGGGAQRGVPFLEDGPREPRAERCSHVFHSVAIVTP
jgi:hypothetical protein